MSGHERRWIYVFDTNRAGHHRRPSARVAATQWMACHGVGEGLTGQAYAIATRDHHDNALSLECIAAVVARFAEHAAHYRRNRFLITEIGCGADAHRATDIVPMFAVMAPFTHVFWPARWARRLGVDRVSFDESNNRIAPP